MSASEVFTLDVQWKSHPHNERYFYAYIGSRLVLLRMNDFPDEPLFTLIDGLQITDFDDAPINWIIPNNS